MRHPLVVATGLLTLSGALGKSGKTETNEVRLSSETQVLECSCSGCGHIRDLDGSHYSFAGVGPHTLVDDGEVFATIDDDHFASSI